MLGDPSTSLHFAQDDTLSIYNAFIMPYCADAEGASASSATFQMKRVGYIYGDWKNVEDENRPYYKIHCILLDMKSVMRNYANNPAAQSELAKLIPH
jgi:hypothetical protein